MNYAELWDAAVAKLEADFPSANVNYGKYGVSPSSAPFVWVFMEPDVDYPISGKAPKTRRARIIIACGAKVESESHKSVVAAIDMAEKAAASLVELEQISATADKIELDGVYTNAVTALASVRAYYKASE